MVQTEMVIVKCLLTKKKRQLRPLWIHRKMHARRLSKKTYSQFLLLVKKK